MGSVQNVLTKAVESKIGSGIAAAWGDLSKRESHTFYVGKESHSQEAFDIQPLTKFDLASLTKVIATTSLFMRWVDEEKIVLDDPFPGHHHDFTTAHLLRHCSGLPAHENFFESLKQQFGDADTMAAVPVEKRKKAFYDQLFAAVSKPLLQAPGEKIIYSDLGFLLLTHFVEVIRKKSFDQVVQKEVWDRIFQADTGFEYRPVKSRTWTPGIAATEICPWRGLLQGEVHDDNCWSMGGVAGHAGVFGTLNDLVQWMHHLVEGKLASFATLKKFSAPFTDRHGNRRALGFDLPSLDGSGSTATMFSPNSIGHLGFTGTSFWFDLDSGRYAILLTNRVHPSRDDNRIRDLRREFHQVAFSR